MYTEAVLIPSLPTIQRQFGVTPSDVSWVLSIYLLTGTISVALFGKLGDMYGKKKLFLLALSIYTLGVTFTGFAPSFRLLLLSRALQGLGMAIFPLGFTIVREEFPPRMVPQVQGMISAMFAVGIAVALPLGSYIAENYGWEWTYHTIIPFALLLLVLSARVLRESRYVSGGRLDLVGLILLSVFSSSSLVAVTRAPHVGWSSLETVSLLLVSLVSLMLFIIWESRVGDPLIPLYLLGERNVMIANIGISMAAFAIQMMMQANTYILQMPEPIGYGKTILEAGLLMTPTALVMLVVAPLVGRLMVRVGAKPFAVLGVLFSIAGLLLLSWDPVGIGLYQFVALIVVVSTGISIINVSLINVLIFSVEKRFMGIATGLNSLFRNIGASWGPAVAGTFMTVYHTVVTLAGPRGPVRITVPSEEAFRYLFLFAALLYLVVLVLSLMIVEVVKMPDG